MDDRQRLEAIVSVVCKYLPPDGIPIKDAMSEIISIVDPLPPLPVQPVQEPAGSVVRWVDGSLIHGWFGNPPPEGTLLYATPPQRQWVGLTDDEVSKILDDEIGFNSCWGPEKDFARAIEAKLKDKNT